MIKDLLYSFRLLRRSPGFAIAAIATLALAIGANTAVFTIVNAVFLRPLPIHEPGRVVVIWPRERANPTTVGEISHFIFREWQQQARSFEHVAAIGSVNWSLHYIEGDKRVQLTAAAVSASFFPMMGTAPALGRTLAPEDDRTGAPKVVVMSHDCWRNRFGADPGVVGRRLRTPGGAVTVVGVMPQGFDYPRGAEVWMPVVPELVGAGAEWKVDALNEPGFGVLWAMARLKAGVAHETARAELTRLIERATGTAFRPGMEAHLTPILEHIFGKTRPAFLALAACVGVLLLIACANVAALLIVRAVARSHEFAVRLALGASRWRILRQSFADALLVSLIGAAVGLVLAFWSVKALVALAPADVPQLDTVRFNLSSAGFAWLLALIAAALAGLGPGAHVSRWTLTETLKAGSARLAGARSIRRGFVAVQVAMALALLIGAGLMVRSFANLMQLDFGFKPRGVLTLNVDVPDVAGPDRVKLIPFFKTLLERIGAMPGVEAAGAIFLRPLEHAGIGLDGGVLIEGQRLGPDYSGDWDRNPAVNYEAITPDYFHAMGIPVLQGRSFNRSDTASAAQVVIVSDGLARRLWPGKRAIGQRLLRSDGFDKEKRPRWSTVVGVVSDVRYRGLTDVRFDLYVPFEQKPDTPVKHLMIRTSGNPIAVAGAIRAEAKRLEPTATVDGITTMDQIVGRTVAPWRFSASTLGALGALALGLAILGVYGIVSQSVVERTREIAVRVALGAVPRDVVRLVLRDGMPMTLVGVAAGLAAGVGIGRVTSALLFGVTPLDPVTFASMAVLFVIVSAAATLIPARRALRIDPASALRQD